MYRILLVDDEPLILAGISSMLDSEESRYRIVGKAFNGKQALDKMEELHPDIVITDIKMPAMDGITFMKEAVEKGYPSVFILLTNLEEFSLAKEAMRLGAVDYLVKLELSEEVLIQSIERAMERCGSNQRAVSPLEQPENWENTAEEKIREYFRHILIYSTEISVDEELEKTVRVRFQRSVLMLINFDYGFEDFSKAFTRADQKKVMDFAENIISGMVKGFFDNSCLLRREQSGFLLILSLDGVSDYHNQIRIMSRKFRQVMKDYFEVPILIAVSENGNTGGGVSRAFI